MGLRPTNRDENPVGQASTPAAGLQTRPWWDRLKPVMGELRSPKSGPTRPAQAASLPHGGGQNVEKRWVFDRAAGVHAGLRPTLLAGMADLP